jgi:hypothetical protein
MRIFQAKIFPDQVSTRPLIIIFPRSTPFYSPTFQHRTISPYKSPLLRQPNSSSTMIFIEYRQEDYTIWIPEPKRKPFGSETALLQHLYHNKPARTKLLTSAQIKRPTPADSIRANHPLLNFPLLIHPMTSDRLLTESIERRLSFLSCAPIIRL